MRHSPFFSLGSMVVVWILCMQNISIADFFFYHHQKHENEGVDRSTIA